MMDKVKINTQIVQMRKYVKQAKIHVISKFVKQARLLQNRNGGAENKILKCRRKAERLLAEIVILKKIKPDSVSKMALTKAKDWKTVLAEKNVSLEDRCFAMLANFDAVQKEVDKFYNTNGEVLSEVTTLMERLGSTTKRKRLHQNNKKNNTGQASYINKSVEEYKQYIKSDAESDNEELMEDETDESNTNQYENTENKLFTKINSKDGSKSFNNTTQKERNSSKIIEDKKNEELQSSSELSGLDPDSELEAEEKNVEHKKGKKKSKNSLKLKNTHLQNNLELSDMDQYAEMSETKNKMQKQTLDIENVEQQSNSELSDMDHDSGLEYKGKNVAHKKAEVNFKTDLSPKYGKPDISKKLQSKKKSTQKVEQATTSKTITISKSMDIQSRLLAIANYPSAKPANHKGNSLSVKKSQANLKAIAVLNLDELQDLAEIPIQSPKTKAENPQESKTRKEDSCLNTGDEKESSEGENDTDGSNEDSFVGKKDSFFLTGGAVSDSNREGDPPSFDTKKFGRFDRQNSNNTELSNQRFQRDSHRGPSFSKNGFQKDNFKDKNMPFKGERHTGSGFNKSQKFAPTERKRFDDRPNFNKHGKGDFPTKHFERNSYNKHQEKANFQKNETKKFQKGKPDDKPLHPSWEAKKKMKEAQNTKFQGKRIVFD